MSKTIEITRPVSDAQPQPASKKRFSPARLAAGLLLVAWAALFWFVLLSGRTVLYLGFRTLWVVPVGAVALTAAAVGRLLSARVEHPEPLKIKEAFIIGAMILPVLAIMVLPAATLNSYAVKGRTTLASAVTSLSTGVSAGGQLSLIAIASSPATELGVKALASHEGETVTFEGFVNRFPDTPADEFYLTRFVITCCVADATIASVRIVNVTPGQYATNQWVQVTGVFYPIGKDAVVAQTKIVKIPTPKNPYLTP
jgi:uncharacterized repeat protein (TIGR03943 family)